MKITKLDKKRYKLYKKTNQFGRPVYEVAEIGKMTGNVSRQAVYLSLRKFPDWEEIKKDCHLTRK